MRISVLTTAFAILLCSAAAAHSYKVGDISIGHVWTRTTTSGATTDAIYFPLLNAGKDADTLLGASSELAEKIEIHKTENDNGVMKMKKVESVVLEPNKPVAFMPRGLHLMVFGLKNQLMAGDKLPITLKFEKAGEIKVDAVAQSQAEKMDHK